MKFKNFIVVTHWILSAQFGLDPRRFIRSIRGLPAFLWDWLKFRNRFKGKLVLLPCLHDRYEEGGTTKSEYFWQDLLVARWIHAASPRKHVDIGSRVDGFVAHVAAFREIEVFDVRPITTTIPGVVFRQADLMNAESLTEVCGGTGGGYCDSLSCLHALEHFGLGRYGDPINPLGYLLGLQNMFKLLKPGGVFYLSTPVGKERVEFNANWVFDPRTILSAAVNAGLSLKTLTIFIHMNGVSEIEPTESALAELAGQDYNLGIFTFIRPVDAN
jgi:SAM-dependent methyltransferase